MDDITQLPAGAKMTSQGSAVKDTVRSKRKAYSVSTQRYLPIAEIREDTVMLKNGGLRAVLKVNSLNFNLKSEIEQQGIIAGYQGFLNTLIFPIQILVRSTRLNIDPYLKTLRDKTQAQTNPLLKEQTVDYTTFMEKLVDIADIMQKNFYIIVPMDATSKAKRGLFARFFDWMSVDDTRSKALQRSREFHAYSKILRDRVTLVQSGLENVGITMRRLKTDELVQLYYTIYNPVSSQKEKFNATAELNIDKSALF
jgi:hypothetical protein